MDLLLAGNLLIEDDASICVSLCCPVILVGVSIGYQHPSGW